MMGHESHLGEDTSAYIIRRSFNNNHITIDPLQKHWQHCVWLDYRHRHRRRVSRIRHGKGKTVAAVLYNVLEPRVARALRRRLAPIERNLRLQMCLLSFLLDCE